MLLHPVDDRVVDVAVRGVTPPGEHVGVGEHLLGQAVLLLLQPGGPHVHVVAELRPEAAAIVSCIVSG